MRHFTDMLWIVMLAIVPTTTAAAGTCRATTNDVTQEHFFVCMGKSAQAPASQCSVLKSLTTDVAAYVKELNEAGYRCQIIAPGIRSGAPGQATGASVPMLEIVGHSASCKGISGSDFKVLPGAELAGKKVSATVHAQVLCATYPAPDSEWTRRQKAPRADER